MEFRYAIITVIFFVLLGAGLTISLKDMTRTLSLETHCQAINLESKIKIIDGECYYLNKFGWIKSGSTIIDAKDLKTEKQTF